MTSWYCPDLRCFLSPGGLESYHKQNPLVHHPLQWPGPDCGEQLEREEHPFPPGQPVCMGGPVVVLMSCFTLPFGHRIFFMKPGHCVVAGMKGSSFWHQLSSPKAFCLLANGSTAVTFACYCYPAAPPETRTHSQRSQWELGMPCFLAGGKQVSDTLDFFFFKKPLLSIHQLQVLQ